MTRTIVRLDTRRIRRRMGGVTRKRTTAEQFAAMASRHPHPVAGGMRDMMLRMEANAREAAEMHGIDASEWQSLLTATSCYECGCIGCSTGCKTGDRQ